MEFGATYFRIAESILYANLLFLIFFVAREIKRTFGKKVPRVLLVLPFIFILLPVGLRHGTNSFMHLSLGMAFSEDPFASMHCISYSVSECIKTSYPAWSYSYYMLLGPFLHLGEFGVKVLNSLFGFILVYFLFLMLQKNQVSGWFSLLAISPPLISLLRVSHLDTYSAASAMVFLYFLSQKDPFVTAVSGMNFLHIRPENWVYFLILLPRFLPALKSSGTLAIVIPNVFLKVFEFMRGYAFSPEWLPPIKLFLSDLQSKGLENVAFSLDPTKSAFLLFALAFIGVIFSVKKNRDYVLLLLFGFMIYTTHFSGISLYGSIRHRRFLIDLTWLAVPLFLVSLKKLRPSKWLILLFVVPLLIYDFSDTIEGTSYLLAKSYSENISALSNELSMPVVSMFPWLFGNTTSDFLLDDFPFSPGDYLYVNYDPKRNYYSISTNSFDLKNLTSFGELILYNFSYHPPI